MEWLLPRYKSRGARFMKAAKSVAPGGLKVWEFSIAPPWPDVLADLLAYDGSTAHGAPMAAEQQRTCEVFLTGVLWTISAFANGLVPSYLTTCCVKVSVWTLIEYLRQAPRRAQALRAPYGADGDAPLCPLAAAACVLPWRLPVLELLGPVGVGVLGLVQEEFPDSFEFESAKDAQQQRWALDQVWEETAWGPGREPPEELVLQDLRAFDARVRELAADWQAEHKVRFSDGVLLEPAAAESGPPGQSGGEPTGGSAASHAQEEPPAAAAAQALPGRTGLAPGDLVEAYWPPEEMWVPARLAGAGPGGSWRIVLWIDGDEIEGCVPDDGVRPPGGA
ncbi:unnamed protein product, partial [Prorocentrum cordatum]